MATKLVDRFGFEVLGPQPGPQTLFSASEADIVIFGGAAFGGKSYIEVLESTRNIGDPLYTAGLFRKQCTEITMAGGLWDTAAKIYPAVGGVPVKGDLYWRFPAGCRVEFHHLNNEQVKNVYQGAAFVYLAFDELTHFGKKEFFYLLTRNRPPAGCKLKPYCRATCNPEPGWVADLIQWWWDPNTGYPIPERSGVVRYFIAGETGDDIVWVNKDYRDADGDGPKSITFIASMITDNVIGMEADPTYRANLKHQDQVTRERLLKGNWLISEGGNMFKPEWLPVIDELPDGIRLVRCWDFASSEVKEGGQEHQNTKNNPDWTAGVLAGIHDDTFYIADANFFRESPGTTEKKLVDTANTDGHGVSIGWEEEKGAAGAHLSHYLKQVLTGFDAFGVPVSGSKVDRARTWSSWAENGRVKLLRGAWNRKFKEWASKFPNGKRDVIDASSLCFDVLTGPDRVFRYYISDSKHNLRKFPRAQEDFEKITPANVDVYLTLWAEENGAIYGACWVWTKRTQRVKLYGEIIQQNPIPQLVVRDIIEQLVVPIHEKANYVTLKTAFCNELFKKKKKYNMVREFRKYGIRPTVLSIYDEVGAVLTLNKLMATNSFWIHEDCINADAQIRGWHYKDKKVVPGYPLARCACLLASQLRGEMATPVDMGFKPYSKQKMIVRNHLKSTNRPSQVEKTDKQYKYLVQ